MSILGTIWLCANEWMTLNRKIVLNSNTWNYLTLCKQMINIEWKYQCFKFFTVEGFLYIHFLFSRFSTELEAEVEWGAFKLSCYVLEIMYISYIWGYAWPLVGFFLFQNSFIIGILSFNDILRGAYDKFPFFRMGTFIDSTHMKLWSPSK